MAKPRRSQARARQVVKRRQHLRDRIAALVPETQMPDVSTQTRALVWLRANQHIKKQQEQAAKAHHKMLRANGVDYAPASVGGI